MERLSSSLCERRLSTRGQVAHGQREREGQGTPPRKGRSAGVPRVDAALGERSRARLRQPANNLNNAQQQWKESPSGDQSCASDEN